MYYENESSIVSVVGAQRIPLAKKRPQSIDDSPPPPCWYHAMLGDQQKAKMPHKCRKKNLFNIRFKATLVKTEYMLLYPALSVGWIADFSDFRCLFSIKDSLLCDWDKDRDKQHLLFVKLESWENFTFNLSHFQTIAPVSSFGESKV